MHWHLLYSSFLLTHSLSTWKLWSFYRFWSNLQEKQFKSIRILLAESEAAVHEGLIIFLITFINHKLSKGVWVKRIDLYVSRIWEMIWVSRGIDILYRYHISFVELRMHFMHDEKSGSLVFPSTSIYERRYFKSAVWQQVYDGRLHIQIDARAAHTPYCIDM